MLAHSSTDPVVLYVTDAYCGWCYGFDPALVAFWEANRDRVRFEVVSGGLFTGERRQPIAAYPHIPAANARIAKLTGVEFGAAYERLLQEGTFVLDSEAAAAGFAALREQAPERGVEFAVAMQRAFYVDGRSLSDAETYADLARELGLDAERAVAFFTGPEGRGAAERDFAVVQRLGVHKYPTLVLLHQGLAHALPAVGNTAESITRHLDRALGEPARSASTSTPT